MSAVRSLLVSHQQCARTVVKQPCPGHATRLCAVHTPHAHAASSPPTNDAALRGAGQGASASGHWQQRPRRRGGSGGGGGRSGEKAS